MLFCWGMHIYLHSPFCKSHCIYCDFYIVLEKYGGKDAYVDAVCEEIKLRWQNRSDLAPITTLYIGGGTPSLLSAPQYQKILTTFKQFTAFAPDAEITMEANPTGEQTHEVMASSAQDYTDIGINRWSVGVQSFNDNELKTLSRGHDSQSAKGFIAYLQASGANNISIDLMYGVPQQTQTSWQQTLDETTKLGIQHVSMYGLKVEENTPLNQLQRYSEYTLPDDDQTVDMYEAGMSHLKQYGFDRYEFSNLAQLGRESQHNLCYWNNVPFWAFGVAAHGYMDGARYENVRDIIRYIENPLDGEKYTETTQERLENTIIFGLRKAEGIHLPTVNNTFEIDFEAKYQAVLARFEDCFERKSGYLRLSEKAIAVSNTVLLEFLEV